MRLWQGRPNPQDSQCFLFSPCKLTVASKNMFHDRKWHPIYDMVDFAFHWWVFHDLRTKFEFRTDQMIKRNPTCCCSRAPLPLNKTKHPYKMTIETLALQTQIISHHCFSQCILVLTRGSKESSTITCCNLEVTSSNLNKNPLEHFNIHGVACSAIFCFVPPGSHLVPTLLRLFHPCQAKSLHDLSGKAGMKQCHRVLFERS